MTAPQLQTGHWKLATAGRGHSSRPALMAGERSASARQEFGRVHKVPRKDGGRAKARPRH